MRIRTVPLALFAVFGPAKGSITPEHESMFTPAHGEDRGHIVLSAVGSDIRAVIQNSACKYTMGMLMPSETTSDDIALYNEEIPLNYILPEGVKCLDLAKISSLNECPKCAHDVTPSDGSTRITCNRGKPHPLTYEFLDTSKGVGAFANLASSVKLKLASWRKHTFAALVQTQANKLCGFLIYTYYVDVTKAILNDRESAQLDASGLRDYEKLLEKIRAEAETELEEMKARVLGVWRKDLSHMFVEPFQDVIRRAVPHSPVSVVYSVNRLAMETTECGIILPVFWLVPEQRETLERSITSTCLKTPVVPVAAAPGVKYPPYLRSTRMILFETHAPADVNNLEVGGDLVLYCPFEQLIQEYRFKKGGENDPFRNISPGGYGQHVPFNEAGVGFRTAIAVCKQLKAVSGHLQAITGYKSPRRLDEGNDRYTPRLTERFELASLVYWKVFVGDLIASSDNSAVFTVVDRSDIVIKYEASCGGYFHPLRYDYLLGRIAATAGVSPMPLFLSPFAPMSEWCRSTRENSVCAAPGTNPEAKLQFNIFAAGTDMALSNQCRVSGDARYLILERTGSCLDRNLMAGPTSLIEAIHLGVETIKLLQKLHDVGVIHGNIQASSVCHWLEPLSGLALVGFESGRLVSDESDSRSYERPLKTDVEATPWKLEGFHPARRDDIYKTLYMVAKLIHGQSAFDRMTAGKSLNPRDLLSWKQRGPLFRSESFDPIQTWLEAKGLSTEKAPEIHAALNAVHVTVMSLSLMGGSDIPYATIIEQLRSVQRLLPE